jgi:ribosomal protein S18 acetylase RimI-like enzyme
MPIAFRHRTDPRPVLAELTGLAIHQERDADAMACLQRRTTEEIQLRFDNGHRAYVASIDAVPAAWGWVASSVVTVAEVGATLSLGPGERYLWNFVTLAAYRGRGVYPRLLDAMVRAESDEGERFWIAYAPENQASGAGIRKAGFVNVADVSFDLPGYPGGSVDQGRGAGVSLRLPRLIG